MKKRRLLTYGVLILSAGVLAGVQLGSVMFGNDLSKSLRKVDRPLALRRRLARAMMRRSPTGCARVRLLK